MEQILSPIDDTLLRDLGDRLTRYRLNKGLTQAALAEQAGVSKRTVEHLEAGDGIQLHSFLRILRHLNLLDNLDRLVPDPGINPLDAVRTQKRQRQRASKPRQKADSAARTWTWGDET